MLISKKQVKNLLLIIYFTTLSNIVFANDDYDIFTTEEQIIQEKQFYDPLEGMNRKIFAFNQVVDRYSLKPVAKLYRDFIPKPVRNSVRNSIDNLTLPLTTINSLLQLDFKNSFNSLAKFVINSSFGILGLFDVAAKIGIEARKEDFGQTLAKYFMPAGPYLVIPFFGPSNIRDLTGLGAGWALNPVWQNIPDTEHNNYIRYGVSTLKVIDKRGELYDIIEDIEKNSLDPYSVMRNIYYQNRKFLINNE